MSNLPTPGPCEEHVRKARAQAYVEAVSDVLDLARPVRHAKHAWTLTRETDHNRFRWSCSCGDATVYQPYDTAVPADELISHGWEKHGQMRGES